MQFRLKFSHTVRSVYFPVVFIRFRITVYLVTVFAPGYPAAAPVSVKKIYRPFPSLVTTPSTATSAWRGPPALAAGGGRQETTTSRSRGAAASTVTDLQSAAASASDRGRLVARVAPAPAHV